MMCAIAAGRRGRRVLLLDHSRELAPKIKISGGGRCNFTNITLGPEHFISENPDFCRSALARFTPSDFLSYLRNHSIAWHEKTRGQLFCDTSSSAIISMLKKECLEAGVEFRLGIEVGDVRRECLAGVGQFVLETSGGVVCASSLVVASGGLSVPEIGASPIGYPNSAIEV